MLLLREDWAGILFSLYVAGFEPKRPVWYLMKEYEIEHVGIAETEFTWVSAWVFVKSFISEESALIAKILVRLDSEKAFADEVAARAERAARTLADPGQRERMRQLARMCGEGAVCFDLTWDRKSVVVGPCPAGFRHKQDHL